MDKEVVKKGRKKKVRIEEIGNCWKKMEWDEREMQERKKSCDNDVGNNIGWRVINDTATDDD